MDECYPSLAIVQQCILNELLLYFCLCQRAKKNGVDGIRLNKMWNVVLFLWNFRLEYKLGSRLTVELYGAFTHHNRGGGLRLTKGDHEFLTCLFCPSDTADPPYGRADEYKLCRAQSRG
ncbi:hypothetical protein TNCV_3109551 [Trichonephila clavipes]|nr:hypothetical protein TNCV_3109551 [Trichonephila clavipes]